MGYTHRHTHTRTLQNVSANSFQPLQKHLEYVVVISFEGLISPEEYFKGCEVKDKRFNLAKYFSHLSRNEMHCGPNLEGCYSGSLLERKRYTFMS